MLAPQPLRIGVEEQLAAMPQSFWLRHRPGGVGWLRRQLDPPPTLPPLPACDPPAATDVPPCPEPPFAVLPPAPTLFEPELPELPPSVAEPAVPPPV
jgi:hypothetical protein